MNRGAGPPDDAATARARRATADAARSLAAEGLVTGTAGNVSVRAGDRVAVTPTGARRDGRPGELRELWESGPVEGPDGFAIARSGRIYMTLIGSNQIAVLSSGGRELARFPDTPATGDNGSSIPFDNPSSAAFSGRRLIVANQSFLTGNRSHQALLDVHVGELGIRELIPRGAGVRRDRGR